jgi:hypothetical protein
LRKKVQIWWIKNDTSAHIGNLKMTLASATEKEQICVKKCRLGGSKMAQHGSSFSLKS